MGADENFEGARGLFEGGEDEAGPTETETPSCLAAVPLSAEPSATEQSRLFDLLGRVNYAVLRGEGVYLQISGEVYRVLYGLYWQSVLNGAQHWGLRCEAVGCGAWAEGRATASRVDLPLRFTNLGWVVEVASVPCPLSGDLLAGDADAPPRTRFARGRRTSVT